jgi:hypothetical protein
LRLGGHLALAYLCSADTGSTTLNTRAHASSTDRNGSSAAWPRMASSGSAARSTNYYVRADALDELTAWLS